MLKYCSWSICKSGSSLQPWHPAVCCSSEQWQELIWRALTWGPCCQAVCTETLEARPAQHKCFVQCPSCEVSAPLRIPDTGIWGCPNIPKEDHLLQALSMEERGCFLLQLQQCFPRNIKQKASLQKTWKTNSVASNKWVSTITSGGVFGHSSERQVSERQGFWRI